MYKKRVSFQLAKYFMFALLLLSLIVGGLFVTFYKQQMKNINQALLIDRASSIANSAADFISDDISVTKGGFSPYMRLVNDVASGEVWIVDVHGELIKSNAKGRESKAPEYIFSELPQDVDHVIQTALQNEIIIENRILLNGASGLLIGVPVLSQDGNVIGVVLLQAPLSENGEALSAGISIFISSLLVGLIIVIILAFRFSYIFTRPLLSMNKYAQKLALGNYDLKTGIIQDDEIGQLANSLDILADKLNLASQHEARLELLRNNFIANLSHELKTPVTVIRGSLEAIIDEVVQDSETIAHYQKQMLKETLFLQRLISDLLDLSKLESDEFTLQKEEIDLVQIVNDAIFSVDALVRKSNISIEFTTDVKTLAFSGDYDRIMQMLRVILDNAIKFSKPNHNIKISLKNQMLTIFNYGSHINADDLENLFLRFYFTRNEQNKQGTGLGLSIAKQIAKAHDISIEAHNVEQGVSFSLDFSQK